MVAVLVDSDAHPGSDDLEALSGELSAVVQIEFAAAPAAELAAAQRPFEDSAVGAPAAEETSEENK